MNTETVSDLRIVGTGTASSGTYGNVKIVGEGHIDGSIDCVKFACTGTAEVVGSITARSLNICGTCNAAEHLRAEFISVIGQTEIGGKLQVKQMKLNGMTVVGDSVRGERISVRGMMSVQNDCETEHFKLKGGFNIGGLLNAGNVHIVMFRPSKVNELGGERIIVRRASYVKRLFSHFFSLFQFTGLLVLTVDIIEGDEIDLQYTHAKIVRGNRVNIGPGCKIEQIEYRIGMDQSRDAHVAYCKKI